MIASMTGFASRTVSLVVSRTQQVTLSIHVKTLNSRFFEATCRLSQALAPLEMELVKRAKQELCRGQLYLNMTLSDPNCLKQEVTVSIAMIKGYVNALNDMQKQLKLPGTITVNDILNIPNIFVAEESPLNNTLKERILKNFDELIKELQAARDTEGKALKKDLEKRSHLIAEHIEKIKELFKDTLQQQQENLNKEVMNLKKIDKDLANLQQVHLYQELDRTDIHEEIVRFKTHLENFMVVLNNKNYEKGRQLDFIIQELGREVNTIAAKCSDGKISAHAIAIKVELEKCREQIQNIV